MDRSILLLPFLIHRLLCFATLIHLVLSSVVAIAAGPVVSANSEVEALLRWGKLLSLSNWDQYRGNDDPCNWSGITCNHAKSVTGISLPEAQLSGTLGNLNFSSLPNLTHLDLCCNYLYGSIPTSIGSLHKLVHLDLFGNKLSGSIPLEIGNLPSLNYLSLLQNRLTGAIPPSIGNLVLLQSLELSGNDLTGAIPLSIGNLVLLQSLGLSGNDLTGAIPPSIGNLSFLRSLDLSWNLLIGPIPQELALVSQLTQVNLSANNLAGVIPTNIIGSLFHLSYLNLSDNQLSLNYLSLSNNSLTGVIPPSIAKLVFLQSLDLSCQSLTGPIPQEMALMQEVKEVYLSMNFLNGEISIKFFSSKVDTLNLSHNNLSTLPSLPYTGVIADLSYNNLEIPLSWANFYGLKGFLRGNKCCIDDTKVFTAQHPRDNAHGRHWTLIFIVVSALILSVIIVILYKYKCSSGQQKDKETAKDNIEMTNSNIFSILSFDGKVVFEDVIEAIENFDDIYCVGIDGSGIVYEAELPTGQVVVVKRIHSPQNEELSHDTTFINEIHVMTKIRHHNIVKFYGFCLHSRFMFLVCEYMENGSLSEILSNHQRALDLDWERRVRTIIDVASALSYLHHDCSPPIVHRDISTNNILFDSKLRACISDFGAAKLLNPDSSNWTCFVGTCGYVAPGTA